MKILYVTTAWSSLYDLLYKGAEDMNGMPAFEKTLKGLIEEGHEIDLILYDFNNNKDKNYQINSTWFKKINIVNHLYVGDLTGLKKIYSYYKIYKELKAVTYRKITENKYDFVYGHGPVSSASNIASNQLNVPFGQRLYGDTFHTLATRKNYLYSSLFNPLTYLSYKIKKDFILGTNDGSGLEKVYQKIGKKNNYNFYFWLNGVNFKEVNISKRKIEMRTPYLLYVARIAKWKQQHLGIEMVNKLKKQGIFVNLYIAGQISDKNYYDYIMNLIDEYELSNQVKYIGVLENTEINDASKNALACLSLYDICNLGNVFLEYLAAGSVIISLNDGSLEGIVKNGKNGFLIDSLDEGVRLIKDLQTDKINSKKIKEASFLAAKKHVKTWDIRVNDEIELIKKAVRKEKLINEKSI